MNYQFISPTQHALICACGGSQKHMGTNCGYVLGSSVQKHGNCFCFADYSQTVSNLFNFFFIHEVFNCKSPSVLSDEFHMMSILDGLVNLSRGSMIFRKYQPLAYNSQIVPRQQTSLGVLFPQCHKHKSRRDMKGKRPFAT